MRELVISKLKQFIADSDGYGIPSCFDADEDQMVTDPADLSNMDDQQLLEVFEACVGFGG